MRLRPARPSPDLLRSLIAAAVLSAVLVGLRLAGVAEPIELRAYDALIGLRAQQSAPSERERDPGIVLVTIAEDDLQALGHPLPDAVLASAVLRLRELGARTIGIDLYRDKPVPPGAEALTTVAVHPSVFFVEKIAEASDDGIRAPGFVAASQVGASDLLPDRDGVVRRALLYLWDARGEAHLAFGLRLALSVLATDQPPAELRPDGPPEAARRPLRLGAGRLERFLADDGPWRHGDAGDHQILLDHRRAELSFPRVGVRALLDGRVARDAIEGRAVLLGTTATSVRDDFLVPGGGLLGEPRAVRGIEIHAALLDQLLRVARDADAPLRFADERMESLGILAIGIAGGLVAHVGSTPLAVVGLPLLCVAGIAGGGAALFLYGVLVPIVPLAFIFLAGGAATQARLRVAERRARSAIERLLTPHVAEGVREVLFAHRRTLLRGEPLPPSRAFATLLFADVAGWSEIAGQLSPEHALEWLGAVLGPVVTAVEAAGGTVEDFAGDGIKACFGAFERDRGETSRRNAAASAVGCARRIAQGVGTLDARMRADGLPRVRLRLGLHAGEVMIGSIGPPSRLKLASVGSTVNAAARIERLGHDSGEVTAMPSAAGLSRASASDADPCHVFVSESVVALLDDDTKHGLALAPLGPQQLRGSDTPIWVWRLVLSLVLALSPSPIASAESTKGTDQVTGRTGAAATADGPTTPAADSNPPEPTRAGASTQAGAGARDAALAVTPYVPPPPQQRVSWRRIGGATRGALRCATTVTAFVPAEHAGLTVRAAPTLVFSLDRATKCPIEVVVNDPRALAPVIEVRLPGPFEAGLHRFDLRGHGLVMEPGLTYTWFVQVMADAASRSSDLVAGGGVRRIVDAAASPDDDAPEALLARGLEMARASLWYDAVADLAGAAARNADGASAALDSVLAGEGLSTTAR